MLCRQKRSSLPPAISIAAGQSSLSSAKRLTFERKTVPASNNIEEQ
jgi:hypothetical protein